MPLNQLVACEGDDDSVTKANAADMSSADPCQEEKSSPQGLKAGKHITGACCLVALQDEISSPHVSPAAQISLSVPAIWK